MAAKSQDTSSTLRSSILGQPVRCCDERQKAMFLQKEIGIVRLVVVVELLEDARTTSSAIFLKSRFSQRDS